MKYFKVEVYCGIKYVYIIYKKFIIIVDVYYVVFIFIVENLYKIVLMNVVKLNVNFL